jgi:hypothetical protein
MLSRKISSMKRISWLVGLLALVALACNAPFGGAETPSLPQPVISVTTQAIQTPVESPTAEVGPDTGTVGGSTILPTFTPIQVTAPPGATTAPTVIPTEAVPATPSPTATSASGGPLNFTYTIHWELASGNPGIAIATVTISATGGGGVYQYFRDDLPVAGPVFQYEWAACHGNPGSLRVDSADGQSARVDYFETPPCQGS